MDLRQGTGIAAAGDAVGDAGLRRRPRWPGGRGGRRRRLCIGDEGLDARVAYVLKLLVVGRVHVGFMRVVAGGAPAYVPDFGEVGVGGFEGGQLFEGIGGELGGEGFEGEGLIASGDVEVEIAPGAPPERLERAMLAAVGEEAVGQAEGFAVGDFVAVAFVLVFVVEGFGVGEDDFGAFAAGDGELGIGGGQGLAVERLAGNGDLPSARWVSRETQGDSYGARRTPSFPSTERLCLRQLPCTPCAAARRGSGPMDCRR
jgi:hypothetical protein